MLDEAPLHAGCDVVVVGGGPAGATAADELAKLGHNVVLLDRAGRIKPCGGAIPPRLIKDFSIPDSLLTAKITSARMVSPKNACVDIPIAGGFVGMVDRDVFDEWLRRRAASSGASRREGTVIGLDRDPDGTRVVVYLPDGAADRSRTCRIWTRAVIGADGAVSTVARSAMPKSKTCFVFAYHEIVRSPTRQLETVNFLGSRCDVIYNGATSPDFYSWVFPHGATTSVGTGSAHKGFSLRRAVNDIRQKTGLDGAETLRREGAPIPLKPRARWDDGADVLLAGDAAGVVAPASGEGIYYAMDCGREAATAVSAFLASGNPRELAGARRRFMRKHGRVFWILRMMQAFWYRNDRLRERFVAICRDKDVQRLTFDAYMNKELVRREPMAHVRVFLKDVAHLMGLVRV